MARSTLTSTRPRRRPRVSAHGPCLSSACGETVVTLFSASLLLSLVNCVTHPSYMCRPGLDELNGKRRGFPCKDAPGPGRGQSACALLAPPTGGPCGARRQAAGPAPGRGATCRGLAWSRVAKFAKVGYFDRNPRGPQPRRTPARSADPSCLAGGSVNLALGNGLRPLPAEPAPAPCPAGGGQSLQTGTCDTTAN